jgi:hypothetical protein
MSDVWHEFNWIIATTNVTIPIHFLFIGQLHKSSDLHFEIFLFVDDSFPINYMNT